MSGAPSVALCVHVVWWRWTLQSNLLNTEYFVKLKLIKFIQFELRTISTIHVHLFLVIWFGLFGTGIRSQCNRDSRVDLMLMVDFPVYRTNLIDYNHKSYKLLSICLAVNLTGCHWSQRCLYIRRVTPWENWYPLRHIIDKMVIPCKIHVPSIWGT